MSIPELTGLTDHQMHTVYSAAATIPFNDRERFLRDVIARLGSAPSDSAVRQAVDLALRVNRLPNFATPGAK